MTESALGPRRLPFIILASLLLLYSCAGLLVDVRGQSDPVVVSQLCRVFVCAENLELQHAYGRFWPEQENIQWLEAAIRQSLIRNPAYPYRWCDLGDVLLASGQAAAARYSFERASQLDSDHVEPWIARATVEQEVGNFAAAIQLLDVARQRRPADPQVMMNLGYAHERLGHATAAIECYEAVLALLPANQNASAQRQLIAERVLSLTGAGSDAVTSSH